MQKDPFGGGDMGGGGGSSFGISDIGMYGPDNNHMPLPGSGGVGGVGGIRGSADRGRRGARSENRGARMPGGWGNII